MKRKRDYKTIQFGVKTRSEYDNIHYKAIKKFGNNRVADCQYLRFCIKETNRRMTISEREKATALVLLQENINQLMRQTSDSEMLNNLNCMQKEMKKLWVI